MMEEEKLRIKEEEGSVFEEEEEEEDEDDDDPDDDNNGDDDYEDPVIAKQTDIPSYKKSVSDLSALSYEMFVEQTKEMGDDNQDEAESREDNLEEEAEETRELVMSPSDTNSQRKVRTCIPLFSSAAMQLIHWDTLENLQKLHFCN